MIISSFLLQVVHAKPVGCNSELASIPVIAPTVHDGKAVGKLVLLPQPSGEEATFPAALDGSPFGFYYAASPSTKWTINIQGGGWCYCALVAPPRSASRIRYHVCCAVPHVLYDLLPSCWTARTVL